MKTNTIEFKPSNIHQGHYVYLNGQETGIVVNLFAYQTILEYKNAIDKKINEWNPRIETENEINFDTRDVDEKPFEQQHGSY